MTQTEFVAKYAARFPHTAALLKRLDDATAFIWNDLMGQLDGQPDKQTAAMQWMLTLCDRAAGVERELVACEELGLSTVLFGLPAAARGEPERKPAPPPAQHGKPQHSRKDDPIT